MIRVRRGKQKRPSSSRRLRCESLEERAVLAAVIATGELPPSSNEAIETSVRTFIETAVENAMGSQGQAELKSSVTVESGVADDGRSVKITNFLLEFDSSSPESSSARPDSVVGTTSLYFTFVLYPDRSLSFRATLSTSTNDAFPIATPSLQTEVDGASVFDFSVGSDDGADQQAVLRSINSRPVRQRIEPGDRLGFASEFTASSVNLGLGERQDSRSAAGQPSAEGVLPEVTVIDAIAGDATAGMLRFHFEQTESVRDAALQRPGLDAQSGFASGNEEEPAPKQQAMQPLAAGLPVPDGMIGLDYAQTQARTRGESGFAVAASATMVNPSAVLQVFVQSARWVARISPSSKLLDQAQFDRMVAGDEVQEVEYPQSLSILSAACGVLLTVQVCSWQSTSTQRSVHRARAKLCPTAW